MMSRLAVLPLAGILALNLFAQHGAGPQGNPPAPPANSAAAAPAPAKVEEKTSKTEHSIQLNGQTIKYTAVAGTTVLKKEDGTPTASIFYIAYTKDDVADISRRPLTFAFNGGPGSSSVWLHMGAIGPRRVRLQSNGDMPRPPFELEDNQETWLDRTDLVFIDPVGTGYSRPAKKDLGRSSGV